MRALKRTETVLRTDTQVFDVILQNIILQEEGSGREFPALEITIRVGSPDVSSPYGYQGMTLVIRKDSDILTVLRDWADLMQLLPQAIMEHYL